MKKFFVLALVLFANTAIAVDFVIPEINTKFTAVDSSISAIETIADGTILMGNGSNVGTEVTPSGDVTMSNAGVNAISAGVILNADVNASAAVAYSKLNLTASVVEADQVIATASGLQMARVAAATWDFAVDGGSIGAIDLGVTIPAKSIINFCYFYSVTQPVDAGAGTGALHCEDADNLFAAADVTGIATAGEIILGIPQNGAANMVKAIAADCNLTWTIAGAASTAGKLNFYCEYVAHD